MGKLKNFFSGRNVYLIISVTVLVTLLLAGSFLIGPMLADAVKDPQKFRESLGSGFESYIIFIGIQILQVIFAFIPGEAVEFAAGYVFGAFWGTVLCLIGVAIATALVFGLTRLLGRKFTEIMLDKKDLKKLKFLNDEKNLEWIFAILYFIIGTPKDVITYFAGITKIKFGVFMVISTLCRIPSVLTSAIAGQALGEENYILSIIIFVVSAVVALAGYFIYYKISKRKEKN
ncbi:MAG: TVP38/TMEM64 family protein [Ruminococcaceae bacterium]|nr:TVP38/TMEM64 family protein [Oscillospiraceae bacterium]